MTVDPIVRQREARRAYGDPNKTDWHGMRRNGVVPPPDGYLGPRSPFWFASTLTAALKALATRPKPIETRPTRRRKAETATTTEAA